MTDFEQLKLIEPLQRALFEANHHQPTAIQSKTIPPALEGYDILGCAQTGTGKTAAFALPILDYLAGEPGKAKAKQPFVLILAPTRELAIQIGRSFDEYGAYLKLRTTVIFGGVSQQSQVRSLHQGTDILVATPGRLLDLMHQGHIDLSQLEIFVLDEADRMLDMGFLPDLKRIIRTLPEERQSLFFSATLSPKISQLAKTLLYEPVVVDVTPKAKSVDKIHQRFLEVEPKHKVDQLKSILCDPLVQLSVIFTRTKRTANQVERKLKQHGINAGAIHGNKSQSSRQKTLDAFRSGDIKVLVATDVAARGLDVSDLSHVINYDVPADPESYVHRIGRTGRAGAVGTAITFYNQVQLPELQAIERFLGIRVLNGQADRSRQSSTTPVNSARRQERSSTGGRRFTNAPKTKSPLGHPPRNQAANRSTPKKQATKRVQTV